MSIENRREREKEEMRELILSASNEIVTSEGFDKLSIRKIADKIEYSPSIIYHYFTDKDEILNILMERGYKKIVTAISSVKIEGDSPEDRLKEMIRNYIEAALSMQDEFVAAHLNESPQALKHTSTLFEGASKEKPALTSLYKCIKEINKGKEIADKTIELTSQIIAVSALGLIIKLIKEKDIGDEQRQTLINYFSESAVLRMAKINERSI
jgi:AcrR family transcriptional regulator